MSKWYMAMECWPLDFQFYIKKPHFNYFWSNIFKRRDGRVDLVISECIQDLTCAVCWFLYDERQGLTWYIRRWERRSWRCEWCPAILTCTPTAPWRSFQSLLAVYQTLLLQMQPVLDKENFRHVAGLVVHLSSISHHLLLVDFFHFLSAWIRHLKCLLPVLPKKRNWHSVLRTNTKSYPVVVPLVTSRNHLGTKVKNVM